MKKIGMSVRDKRYFLAGLILAIFGIVMLAFLTWYDGTTFQKNGQEYMHVVDANTYIAMAIATVAGFVIMILAFLHHIRRRPSAEGLSANSEGPKDEAAAIVKPVQAKAVGSCPRCGAVIVRDQQVCVNCKWSVDANQLDPIAPDKES